MAHLQYMPGDPRLVDQLVYELKSKGIFDQFRKECIADVDTRPAYQNLRQRVESSVTTFLSRQSWKQDLNKNQLREKLRKHILDGNYLEQGVERIVDQVVNPKVASVFIPQVEDLVYNYLGITRKKSTPTTTESTEVKAIADLPTDLEAVSPGSVKSNDGDKHEQDIGMEAKDESMDVDEDKETKDEHSLSSEPEKEKPLVEDIMPCVNESSKDSEMSIDKSTIPLPEEMKPENIPPPENSPPKLDLCKIELPKTPDEYAHLPDNPTDIPLPIDVPNLNDNCFKPINPNSDNDDSSSDSSLIRNMSPLTPVRNFNTENSCDAQQAFDNYSDKKTNDKKEPISFKFAIEAKSPENDSNDSKQKKKDSEQVSLADQFNDQVNINALNTPFYEDSSNSHNLQIDYESDINSKTNVENKVPEADNSEDAKKEKKSDHKRSSHKSSHRPNSRGTSSSKDRKSSSKQPSTKDSSRNDKKTRDDHSKSKSKSSNKEGERSKDKSERKDSRDSSKHRSSHKSSSSQKDSKTNRSSSSSQKSTSKPTDDKKSSHRDKSEKSSDKNKDKKDSKYGSHDSKSSTHRSEKDKKSSSKSNNEKDKKKDKKDTDDHYSLSGRGNPNRRSTDRDSNDGSSSSKGSQNHTNPKTVETKKETKNSKSENTTSSDSTSPSDSEQKVSNTENNVKSVPTVKPIVRVETQLEVPITSPPRLPFVPDVTLKKPKFAANLQEAKKMMKMRKFLDEEQKRMNQEAALLLEFQANVRPSLSQAYSSIPGPELEFACVTSLAQNAVKNQVTYELVQTENKEDEYNKIQENSQDMIIDDPSEAGNASNIINNIEGACLNNENIEIATNVQTDIEKEIVKNCELSKKVVADNSILMNLDNNNVNNLQVNEKKNETYEENKPFSKLVEEITEYSKASERMKQTEKPSVDMHEIKDRSELFEVTIITEELSENEEVEEKVTEELSENEEIPENEKTVNIVSEELSENEEVEKKVTEESFKNKEADERVIEDSPESGKVNMEITEEFFENEEVEVKVTEKVKKSVSEEMSENEELEKKVTKQISENVVDEDKVIDELSENEKTEDQTHKEVSRECPDEEILHYFAEHEKYDAELKKHVYLSFLKKIQETPTLGHKMYLVNCDSYRENIFREVCNSFGKFEIVNYIRNGHLKLPNAKNVGNLDTEIVLPDRSQTPVRSVVFSPVKFECSFDLSNDYDAKLEEMVNKTSKQEVMEIIMGGIIMDEAMPTIDYCTESNIISDSSLKRKALNLESAMNNNRHILTPNKIRKLSGSDQISSTTEENEESSNNNKIAVNNTRSKYLGRARRVGLPKPRKPNHPNSPSSDKSVENYEQNSTQQPPNGKLKTPQRIKIQRYDTSDLYKPKLHYLSRRNNIS